MIYAQLLLQDQKHTYPKSQTVFEKPVWKTETSKIESLIIIKDFMYGSGQDRGPVCKGYRWNVEIMLSTNIKLKKF
jgi:hypothetical protein